MDKFHFFFLFFFLFLVSRDSGWMDTRDVDEEFRDVLLPLMRLRCWRFRVLLPMGVVMHLVSLYALTIRRWSM